MGPRPFQRITASPDGSDTLWRLCTRMITPAEAGRRVEVTGDRDLAEHVLQIVSIIR